MTEITDETKSVEGVPEKVYATIDDFMKIEIKVGTVLSVDVVEGADKLVDDTTVVVADAGK